MDASLQVQFDAQPGLSFGQGEDRSVTLTLIDTNTATPINLTGGVVQVSLPLSGGGSIKRTNTGPLVNAAQVVVAVGSAAGYISLPDHGLVTGDPIQVAVVSGSLPSPLAVLTNYLVQTIDNNNFYITDTSGNIISLTTQGSGSFNLVNSNDIQITTGDLGKVTFNLRALVSAMVNAGLMQDFQVSYTLSGKTRIAVLSAQLDCTAQPVP